MSRSARVTGRPRSTSARPGIPVGEDILQGSPLFDAYKLFNGDYHAYGRNLSAWEKAREALRLWWWLRQQRFDTVVYLAPSVRDRAQIQRDLRFEARTTAAVCEMVAATGGASIR